MVDLEQVEDEILHLEKKDTSYAVVERLAWLYIVSDHLREAAKKAAPASEQSSETEFEAAIRGKHPREVWALVSELLESVRITQPNLYASYMRKFDALGDAGDAGDAMDAAGQGVAGQY